MKTLAVLFILVWVYQPRAYAAQYKTEKLRISVTPYAKGFDKPWGLSFLPNGDLLVTEKPGRLQIVSKKGKKQRVTGIKGVKYSGQGGLLDVLVDPEFKKTSYVFLSFSEKRRGGSGTSVARAKLKGTSLVDFQVIWRQQPTVDSSYHFGSRLVLNPKRELFITMGDRYGEMDQAQTLDTHFGKVVRVDINGKPISSNPFYKSKNAKKDIWSYGHRNVQGAVWHPQYNELWTHEHGAKGGDEINITRAGKNYGWPVITHGVDYSGAKIGIGTHKKGMEQPLHFWNPSIAPCGMIVYSGKMFPEWKGDVLVGSLKFRYLNRMTLKNKKVVGEEKLLTQLNDRIRDVEEGPDGALYVAVDKMGSSILRVSR